MFSRKQAFLFALFEVILLLVIALEVRNIVAASLRIKSIPFLEFETTFFESTILLFLVVLILALAQIFVVKKDRNISEIHKGFSKVILGSVKNKIFGLRTEIIALWIAEFAFASVIAISIYVYLDPEVNIVPFPYNIIGFAGLLAFGFLIFSHTEPYRRAVYGRGFLQSKIRRSSSPKSSKKNSVPGNKRTPENKKKRNAKRKRR